MTQAPDQPRIMQEADPDGLGLIRRVPPARFDEAIDRLIGGSRAAPAAGRHFLAVARDAGVDLNRVWVRLDHQGTIAATVLCVPNAGRAAMVFASPVTTAEELALVAPVIDAAARDLRHEPIRIAQSLIDPGDRRLRDAFNDAGFHTLAYLSYMDRPLSARRVPAAPRWPAGIELKPFQNKLDAQLIEILDASYEGTLDCPDLQGIRDTPDILAGHKATGEFDPNLWTLLYLDDRPSGALLLNPAPASAVIELVYLGLAPHARSRGLGSRLLHHGLRLVAGRHERTMTLAVDDQNAPALSLYRREGFRRIQRRHAMIRSLTTIDS